MKTCLLLLFVLLFRGSVCYVIISLLLEISILLLVLNFPLGPLLRKPCTQKSIVSSCCCFHFLQSHKLLVSQLDQPEAALAFPLKLAWPLDRHRKIGKNAHDREGHPFPSDQFLQ